MFGLVCSGRPVQTDAVPVDDGKFAFTIQDASLVKNIVLFLTQPIQPNTIITGTLDTLALMI